MAYGVKSSMIVAATREDYVNAQLEAGYAESDELAMAAYLDDDDIILLNSEEINTQEGRAEVITHENAHSITHTPTLWNKLALIHDALNKDDIRALQEKFLPDYDKVTTQQVLDEIIFNFVAYLSTKKENGVYLLRGYLMGDKDVDTLVDTIRKTAIKKFGNEYAYIVDALLPILSENLLIQKELYNGQKESPIVIPRESVGGDEKRDAQSTDDNDISRDGGQNHSHRGAYRGAKGEVISRFALRDGGITSKFSLAETEVRFILKNYDDIQDIATAVEAVVKRYPKDSVMLANVLSDYRQNADEEELIQSLRTFAKYFGDKQERDRSEDKAIIEETFGGIWIEDRAEFAKVAKAVNNTPFEENGEGIAYTDNYFYAYYRSIDGQPIPFASVYMNKDDSQDIVNTILKAKRNGEKAGIRRYFDRAYERARHISGKNDGDLGTNKELSNPRRNDRMDSKLSRYGAYYDSPELYSKVKRVDSGSRGRGKVNYSLITPEMDASYLDAVERGDMETAQKMVMEAAKLAIHNTTSLISGATLTFERNISLIISYSPTSSHGHHDISSAWSCRHRCRYSHP